MGFDLKTLSVANFQSLKAPCSLPIRPLTLLFGPNSAGKSAINDALALVSMMLGNQWFDRRKECTALINRWKYNDGSENSSAPLTLAVEGELQGSLGEWDYSNSSSVYLFWNILRQKYPDLATGWPDSRPLSIQIEIDESDVHIEYSLDNLPIIGISPERIDIHLDHPLLLDVFRSRLPPEIFNSVRGDDSIRVTVNECLFRLDGAQTEGRYIHWTEFQEWLDLDESFCDLVIRTTELFTILISENVANALQPLCVSGQRTVPRHSELVFYVPHNEVLGRKDYRKRKSPLIKLIESQVHFPKTAYFSSLAEAGLAAVLRGLMKESTDNEKENNVVIEPLGRYLDLEDRFNRVNQALSTHLFLERGYQVTIQAQLMLSTPLHEIILNKNIDVDEVMDGSSLVSLGLIDNQGRSVRLDDVGSGISYVLPVLAAGWSYERQIVFIEQPELHLHPALQAGLADALIEITNTGRQLIVETHSEHLILRLLRRIRETNAKRTASPELRFDPDQVSVFYFNPSLDGTTRVRHIRISDTGEFLTPWPRGFFTEREEDLFDE
ncbi:DUF3696 domain-containing protein [Noviherbaspirillum sp. CPCC 100848]|uniref:DUF3696 domain-containing protein n=1 Tax=Noviherbaspirillum album TaxID=3080276 RepID=A0ABU6JIM6_9BURK|nr:DUF3696 domain-containing protein [Noviherbaspirillum sp. CPCC 100848]MEC4723542.1 DUF3696 domain-containing protein [Noviherbaspirillum sp. CPCC 100848]